MIPSHRAPDHVSCLQLESGYTAFGLSDPNVCAFDRACMHSLCKRSISITVCLMKFSMRSLMKHNMRKHYESGGGGGGGLTYCFWCGSRRRRRRFWFQYMNQLVHTVPSLNMPGSPGRYRCCEHPAQVSCAHLSPGAQ